jgi:hypothetical protein
MRQNKESQKNSSQHSMSDTNYYMHNLLIDRCIYNTETDVKNFAVNKMLLVLIFLMVK